MRVSETLPLAGSVGDRGAKTHVAPLGRFKHCRVTAPVAPLAEFRVILKLADCPAESVAEAGIMSPVKSETALTTSVALALRVSEPAVPVRVNGYVPGVTFCVSMLNGREPG